MPVYDYRCRECGRREEHILLAGESAPTACAECGGALKRAWSGGRVRIALEGWGFSRTDALLPDDRPRRDWKTLKERAERIADE
jgi:putative FmdB family regulatory protein